MSSKQAAHQKPRRVELAMEKGNALTQLNAASALLQLTCDAVVELDEDFY